MIFIASLKDQLSSNPYPARNGRVYIGNIGLEENLRVTEDRTAWRKISCAAGAANVRADDAD